MRAIVVLAALGACGDNIAGIPLENYNDMRRTAECERLTRCGLFSTLEACERLLLPALDRDSHQAIGQAKIAYDGVAAKQCFVALAAQSCDATSEEGRMLPAVCARILVGRVGDGDSCAFDAECVSQSCETPACPSGECCLGTCNPTVVQASIGSACTRDHQCASGFCGMDGTCHSRVAAREMCTRDLECEFDLACVGATELEPGRCRDLPPIGEACPYMRCAEIGAVCSSGFCVPVGRVGAVCTSSLDCSRYGECNEEGKCDELPLLGESCTTGCSGDAWCDTTVGRCVAKMPISSPCSAGNQCESTYCEEGPVFDSCSDLPLCI